MIVFGEENACTGYSETLHARVRRPQWRDDISSIMGDLGERLDDAIRTQEGYHRAHDLRTEKYGHASPKRALPYIKFIDR
jgi:hypothetical protein